METTDTVMENERTPMMMTTKVERYTDYALKHLTTRLADDGQPHTHLKKQKNRLAHPLKGRWLKGYLRKAAHSNGELLRNDDLNEIVENLYAHAEVDDTTLKISHRVSRTDEGDIELDRGDNTGERILFQNGKAISITSGSKTLFSRPETMLPLPSPAQTGDWKQLLPFLNMSEEHQHLVVAWMTFVMTHPRGDTAYPILFVRGPQGSGKSHLCRGVIRLFVDNNAAGIQLLPSNVKDMAISARSQYVLAYDNVRSLTKRQSDDLCVMATGGSISSRKLYTDHEESMLNVQAALVLNGIPNVVEEPDLASRVITALALPIDASKRRDDTEMARDLEARSAVIFKGLLDVCAETLQAVPSAKVLYPERLMSFCGWLAASEPAMGLPVGMLQKAYSNNLRDAALESVGENALAITVLNFAKAIPGKKWVGTSTQLLAELNKLAPPQTIHRSSEWPQNPIALSKRLVSVTPLLNSQGIDIGFSHGTQRQVEITYQPPGTEKAIDEPDEPDENADSAAPPGLTDCSPVQDQGGNA